MHVKKRKFVCKHCKVEVLGPRDLRPIMGKTHKKSCPRRRLG